jgi:YidC/Oxa1 family membrane protein insertase
MKCLPAASRATISQQTRSISLFGWGSSSPKPDEFATAHAAPQAPPSQTPTDSAIFNPPSIEQIRSVKASHATSDVPDPSASIPTDLPHTPEPALLKHLENAIADPSGQPPELASDISQIPETIGYLKDACSLDYGWGTTAIMQNILEMIHITGGYPWATSIIGLAVLYRTFLFIFIYRGADQAAKMREMAPLVQPIKDEMVKASAAGDLQKRQQLALEMQAVYKEVKFSPVKLFLPMVLQIPLGFSGFRLLRGCATAPVPAFETESWLWNVDLTMGDPYYITPLLQGALMYFTVRLSQKSGVQVLEGGMGTFMKVGLPSISVIWSSFQPGSVQLFFLASTSLATLQGYLLANNGFRTAIGLMSLPNSSSPSFVAKPGGMTRSPDLPGSGKVIDVEPSPPSSSNRSFVDKMVDKAKAQSAKLNNKSLFSTPEQRAKQAKLQKVQKYEYRRRHEVESEREAKNRTQQPPTTVGPGGMRILKKDEAKRRSK